MNEKELLWRIFLADPKSLPLIGVRVVGIVEAKTADEAVVKAQKKQFTHLYAVLPEGTPLRAAQ